MKLAYIVEHYAVPSETFATDLIDTLSLMEAGAKGLLVVSTLHNGIPERIIEGVNRVTSPGV